MHWFCVLDLKIIHIKDEGQAFISCLPKRVKSDMFGVRILQLVGLQILSIIIIICPVANL